MRKAVLGLLAIVALTASACGGGQEGHDMTGGDDTGGDDMRMEGTVPGEAADPSEADRTIEVVALDQLAFDPSSIEVSSGEVVTFVVTNTGKTKHEFVLGDEAYQEMHEDEMSGPAGMSDSSNEATVGPGEEAEITWRFTETGEVPYGCHEPGHFEGGMVGSITVG